MKHVGILRVAISTWLAVVSPGTLAQTTVVTYVLDDVWLLPDISHPSAPAQQMTGSFDWTYEAGDFENGSGQFLDLHFPWYNPSMDDLNINIDLTSIEFSLVGNFHDLGLDVTLFLIDPLSPAQASAIDTAISVFEIQNGISYQGHAVSGSVVPISGGCTVDLTGDGQSDLADFSYFAGCMSGPAQPVDAACQAADIDGDGDADMADFTAFQLAFGCPQP
ncbi:MAG: hypothetical protein ACE5E6_07660 [Phycisphaerae bacterium]